MFDGLMSELMGDDPTMEPTPRRSRRPSALLPDDLDSFERAAASRATPDLSPPYDPEGERDSRAPRRRKPTLRATKQLRDLLWRKDRFRLRVMRSHIKWARKQAEKHGLSPGEVDLWQL